MPRINSLDARLQELEQAEGWIVLDDGSKFRPASGLALMRSAILFERDNGREPKLADFSMERASLWLKWSKWHPAATTHGSLVEMVSDLARRICEV